MRLAFKYFLIFFLGSFIYSNLHCQEPVINPALKSHLNKNTTPNKPIRVPVSGNHQGILDYCEVHNIDVERMFEEFLILNLNDVQILDLSKSGVVDKIYFENYKGTILMDSCLINNSVTQVHNGTGFPMNYEGNEIILGYIDTGIDINHPDFKNSSGKTRILAIWDQTANGNPPSSFGYGSEWTKEEIDSGICSHIDQINFGGHGTNVAGVGSGNGLATGNYKGTAPKSDIIVVATDFDAPNWTITIAEAVQYIFNLADSLNKPCVINTSVGTYLGSHDGRDLASAMIAAELAGYNSRALVAAAGNSGDDVPFHLGYFPANDTGFTWFQMQNGIGSSGGMGIYFELWSDNTDLDSLRISFGMDKYTPTYQKRSETSYFNFGVRNTNSYYMDSLFNDTNLLGVVESYIEEDSGRSVLYVYMDEPDSSQYHFRLSCTGSGKFDVWSGSTTGTSVMINSSLPDSVSYPTFSNYRIPDTTSNMVSSWQCLDEVVTVGNYANRKTHMDVTGNMQSFNVTPGDLYISSSRGPTRDGRVKPDLAAAGHVILTSGNLPTIASLLSSDPGMVAPGGFHNRNAGTSMASPGVAGMLALYLESCHLISSADLKQKLLSSTRTDLYTGASLPDNSWGFGKADANQLLRNRIINEPLTISGNVSVCRETEVAVTGVHDSIAWNSGESSDSLFLNTAGQYFNYVFDSSGCFGYSDTLNLSIDPFVLSTPTLTITGDSAYCVGDTTMLSVASGYSNYSWSNGGFTNEIIATGTAYYTVTVTNSLGCKGVSDTVLMVELSSPPVPVITDFLDSLVSSIAYAYQWYYEGDVLLGETGKTLVSTDTGYYTLEAFHINGCSTMSLPFYYEPRITGISESGNLGNILIYPNPATDYLKITINPTEAPITELEMYNALGERVFNAKYSNGKTPTIHEISVKSYPAGLYFLYFRQHLDLHSFKLFIH